MRSALPGKKTSPNTAVGLTKVALRLFGLPELANAISDLTGLGNTTMQSMVRTAENELANRTSAEFNAVTTSDREWVESLLTRTYTKLAAEPARQVMSEGLIGPKAVARLAHEAMTADDRRDFDAASDDARAYLTALSESIAYLISEWYSTSPEPNRAAMSQATGESLQTLRSIPNLIEALKTHLDASLGPILLKLEQSTLGDTTSPPEPDPEQIVFELDFSFAPLATRDELNELVTTAVMAVLEGRPVRIEVSLPTLDEDVKRFGDAVRAAQLKRDWKTKAQRRRLALSAFFSPQVEAAWGFHLNGVPDRVTVVRAILMEQQTTGSKLDVWRTTPPVASAPIWLTPDEVKKVVESVGLGHWDHLAGGPGWRDASQLPHSVIVEKVMSSILAELVRRDVTTGENWTADVLFLPSWHIGQG